MSSAVSPLERATQHAHHVDHFRLLGRDHELALLEGVVNGAREGNGGVLALTGEPGLGKSALLRRAEQTASGCVVVRTVGIERESAIPYAALETIVRPLLGSVSGLPPRQAGALRAALGTAEELGTNRFLVGQAVLGLFAEVASSAPVVCIVDDAQWLDPASADALFFACRRIAMEPVGVLVAAREEWAPRRWGVASHRVPGLATPAAAQLASRFGPGMSIVERETVLAQAQGNPLAIREMTAALGSDRADDARPYLFGHAPMPVRHRVEAMFAGQISELPDAAREAVLVAAAAGIADVHVIAAACRQLGRGVADLADAERSGLVATAGTQVTFRHPLVRSAAYQSAPAADRARVHGALAQVMKERGDRWRHAWHLAASTTTPDEEVAAFLVEMAENARRTAGCAAVAAAYERASELSPQAQQRSERRLAAARSAFDAGCRDWSIALLRRLEQVELDPAGQAVLVDLEGALTWHRDHGSSGRRVLAAACKAARLAPEIAEQQIYDITVADWTVGTATATDQLRVGVEHLPDTARMRSSPRLRAASALEHLASGDITACVASLSDVRGWLLETDSIAVEGERIVGRIYRPQLSLLLADGPASDAAATALVASCRTRGVLTALPSALATLAHTRIWTGQLHAAQAAAEEAVALATELDQELDAARARSESLHFLAAIHGERSRCDELFDQARRSSSPVIRDAAGCRAASYALGNADYETALRLLHPVVTGPRRHTLTALCSIADFVEARAFLREPGEVEAPMRTLCAWARATGQPWLVSLSLRCQALTASDDIAGQWYAKALDAAPVDVQPFERARTELLYGGWLRRQSRKTDAQRLLHAARDEFDRLGAVPWAERARAELRAAGESTVPGRGRDGFTKLTPQERQVTRLAAQGMTNREIATQLFLSPRTVGYHLYKAFPKLEIASRHELSRLDLDGSAALIEEEPA